MTASLPTVQKKKKKEKRHPELPVRWEMCGSFFSSAILNSSPTVPSLQLGPQMFKSLSNNFLYVMTPQVQFLSGQKKSRVRSQLLLSYKKKTPTLQYSIMALDISLVLFFQNPKIVTTWVEGHPLLHLHSLSVWAVLYLEQLWFHPAGAAI